MQTLVPLHKAALLGSAGSAEQTRCPLLIPELVLGVRIPPCLDLGTWVSSGFGSPGVFEDLKGLFQPS